MKNSESLESEVRKREIRREVERALEVGDLRLEAPAEGERMRTLGVAFFFHHKTVDVELATPGPTDVVVDPDAQIERLLNCWESLAPDQFEAEWRNHATDPYIGVGLHWAGIANEEAIREWLASDWLAAHEREYPSFSPRRVTLSQIQIVYLEPTRAAVTYRVEEEHQNGKLTAGNTAAVVVDVADKGWRIMVSTKGGREELNRE